MFLTVVLGILLAVAGSALMGFGILFNQLPLAVPLLVSGVLAVIGGFLLFGLSAVVAQLARIAAALGALQPVAQQPVAQQDHTVEFQPVPLEREAAIAREPDKQSAEIIQVPVEAPREVPRDVVRDVPNEAVRDTVPPAIVTSPAADVSESAIERLRSIISRPEKVAPEPRETVPLSPNGQLAAHHVDPASRLGDGLTVEAQEPRLDFLFRQRPGRPTSQPHDGFESLWPTPAVHDESGSGVPRAVSRAARIDEHQVPEPAPSRAVTILKSGVVDGMAYTLYADGSIEAQLPQGTVRFGSIAELRAHIESNV